MISLGRPPIGLDGCAESGADVAGERGDKGARAFQASDPRPA